MMYLILLHFIGILQTRTRPIHFDRFLFLF